MGYKKDLIVSKSFARPVRPDLSPFRMGVPSEALIVCHGT